MNPFKYGIIVSGNNFTNRTREIKEISEGIQAGQHIILISPRRYGKSSLISAVMKKSRFTFFNIDLQILTSEIDFANYYVKKALSLSRFEKLKHFLKNLHIQPSLQINPTNSEISVSFNTMQPDTNMLLTDCLDFPEKIAGSLKNKIVIIFDEFQDIRRISSRLEKQMRALFQHHKNVTYVFIGSSESMIRDIFQNKKNPFYKFGKLITLNLINETDLVKFIADRFKSEKIDASAIINRIIKFTHCHPYYTQQLCHEIYFLADSNKLKPSVIKKSIIKVITDHHSDYLYWWNNLNNTERKLVIGIVSGDYHPTSNKFITKHNIGSPSTAGSALKKLISSGVLVYSENNQIRLEDPFWTEWIIQKRAM